MVVFSADNPSPTVWAVNLPIARTTYSGEDCDRLTLAPCTRADLTALAAACDVRSSVSYTSPGMVKVLS